MRSSTQVGFGRVSAGAGRSESGGGGGGGGGGGDDKAVVRPIRRRAAWRRALPRGRRRSGSGLVACTKIRAGGAKAKAATGDRRPAAGPATAAAAATTIDGRAPPPTAGHRDETRASSLRPVTCCATLSVTANSPRPHHRHHQPTQLPPTCHPANLPTHLIIDHVLMEDRNGNQYGTMLCKILCHFYDPSTGLVHARARARAHA